MYKPVLVAHTQAGGNLTTYVNNAIGYLNASTSYADIAGDLKNSLVGMQQAESSTIVGLARDGMTKVICRTVNADTPLADPNSLPLALAELIRQMVSQSYRVSPMTISASSSAASGNVGTGAIVLTTKRGDGLAQDNQFAETGVLTCTGDAQAGTATSGSEPFSFAGDYAPASIDGYDWPGFSGATASLTSTDAAASTPNLLTNGDFEDFTVANTPDSWTLSGGTAGTDFFSEASVIYAGLKALKITGNGSNGPVIRQTLTTLKPNRVYAVNCWATRSAALSAAGNLTIRLVDGSNATITDDQSAANGVTVANSALTGSYAPYNGVLITPKVLPSTVKIQLTSNDAADLDNTKSIYIDHFAMAEVAPLYVGGPFCGVFSGATAWMTNDSYSITTANNHNAATYGATWQTVFDRLFSMRSLGLLLPTSGTTLLNDSLIA